jgi:Opioid growth factor receptor (OGFr) conserved region
MSTDSIPSRGISHPFWWGEALGSFLLDCSRWRSNRREVRMASNKFTSWIVPFYLGESVDAEQRKIQEIWSWDFEELECAHDYIQWLFPLMEVSAFNSDAPLVDAGVVTAFTEDERLRQNLLKSLIVMLAFYGWTGIVTEDGKLSIKPSADRRDRELEWICPCDHNYLRITRILKCLMTFGLNQPAQAFYTCLEQIYRERSDLIGGETFSYWTKAMKN